MNILERDAEGVTKVAGGTVKVPPTMSALFALGGGIRYPQGLFDGDSIDMEAGVVRTKDGGTRPLQVDIGIRGGRHFYINPENRNPQRLGKFLRTLQAEASRNLKKWQALCADIKSEGMRAYMRQGDGWMVIKYSNGGICTDWLKHKPRAKGNERRFELGERYKLNEQRMNTINGLIRTVTQELNRHVMAMLPEVPDNYDDKFLLVELEGNQWLYFAGGWSRYWTLQKNPTQSLQLIKL